LQKIGLFVGGGPNAAVTVLKQQEQHLSAIKDNTRTLDCCPIFGECAEGHVARRKRWDRWNVDLNV
jgi:hypothetical protein